MKGKIRLLFLASLAATGIAASVRAAEPEPAQASASGHEPPVSSAPPPAGDYLRRMHERIHSRWTLEIPGGATAPKGSATSSGAAVGAEEVTVAIGIRWDGTIAELGVARTSHAAAFDRLALDVTRKSAPFPLPPQDIVSDDGYVHVEWTFARDTRSCAAGARITWVEDPLELSLPRLIQSNRVPEAMRRVAGAVKGGADAPLDRFARLFLARSIPDPVLDVSAAEALASVGDRGQTDRLRGGLGSRATAGIAARGLAHLGIDVCAAVEPALDGGARPARELALEILRARAGEGADVAHCLPSLSRLLGDPTQPSALRLAALDTIVHHVPAGARAAIAVAMHDKDPALRGAGVFASVKKGGGRPEMYRLAPMLHDRAVEVRTAASAGIVRAAGDLALDQLYLLARETDPRPGQAVAEELGQLTSTASAELLGKMLKRNNPPVQVAAARALGGRRDGAAKAQLAELAAEVPAQILKDARDGTRDGAPTVGIASGAPAEDGSASAVASVEPLEQLLHAGHNHEAAEWIVGHWITLPARAGIAVLGTWLGRGGPPASGTSRTASAFPERSTR
jgi:TonB family protein